MESQKIINLLNHRDENDPKFQTKKWYNILITRIIGNMVKEMKTILQLNSVQDL